MGQKLVGGRPPNCAGFWICKQVISGTCDTCPNTVLIVCGFAQAIYFARAKAIHSAFNVQLEHWNGSLFSLSLATNVIGTGIIAFRVWSVLQTFVVDTFSLGFKVVAETQCKYWPGAV